MISPYELVYKSALPALRAMVARRLQDDYHLTQQETADRLGVTQASISNYARRTRGMMVNLETDPVVVAAADNIARGLASKYHDDRDALRYMTEVLDYIRFNHLMCSLHGDIEPDFPVDGCSACDGALSIKDFDKLRPAADNR